MKHVEIYGFFIFVCINPIAGVFTTKAGTFLVCNFIVVPTRFEDDRSFKGRTEILNTINSSIV